MLLLEPIPSQPGAFYNLPEELRCKNCLGDFLDGSSDYIAGIYPCSKLTSSMFSIFIAFLTGFSFKCMC